LQKAEKKYIKNGEVKVMDTTNIGKSKKSKAKEPEPEAEVDTEYDKFHELELTNKDLAEEIELLNDKLAIASSGGSIEDVKSTEQIIAELRSTVKTLEAENDALKSQLATKMNQNAEMMKQLTYYKKRIEKIEKAAA